MAGDGQVTFGDMSFKQKAIKVREFNFSGNKVLGGFAVQQQTHLPYLKNLNKRSNFMREI